MLTKALLKVIEKRTTIPVLSTIRIKDGIATGTDMDFYIHVPVQGFNKEDGDEDLTYHTAGFDKGIFVKSESPAADFPDLSDKGVGFVMDLITIPKTVLIFDDRTFGFSEEQVNIQQCLASGGFNYSELMKG